MRLYLTTVRRWWAVALSLLLLVAVCETMGSSEIAVPSLTAGVSGGAHVSYFAPWLMVVATMYCLDRGLQEAERTAVIGLAWIDRGVVIAGVVLAHLLGPVVGWDVARNVMLLLGIALAFRYLANEAAAAAVPLMFLIFNIVAGRAYQGGGAAMHAWWALPLYPPGSIAAWLVSALVFALALRLLPRRI
ncbi:hypothetical protein [Streptomyces sp. NPDC050392]|uniref:hypothetical protein n=1 Tax=Streptomyces sp. NPDC050392 TaxID=3155782 RepID=UPI0034218617